MFDGDHRQLALPARNPFPCQAAGDQRLVERGHTVVIEARGDRPVDRHRFGRPPEKSSWLRWYCLRTSRNASAAPLAIELVDRHEVGKIQHVDLSNCVSQRRTPVS